LSSPRQLLQLINSGRVAQLGEHLLCKQGVAGSNPVTSTNIFLLFTHLLIGPLADFARFGNIWEQ